MDQGEANLRPWGDNGRGMDHLRWDATRITSTRARRNRRFPDQSLKRVGGEVKGGMVLVRSTGSVSGRKGSVRTIPLCLQLRHSGVSVGLVWEAERGEVRWVW
jgi:molybdenum cofactor biosynthesis enzyme